MRKEIPLRGKKEKLFCKKQKWEKCLLGNLQLLDKMGRRETTFLQKERTGLYARVSSGGDGNPEVATTALELMTN